MEDAEIKEYLDALRQETTRRIGEAGAAGDSAGAQRLAETYTSLDNLARRYGVGQGAGDAG